MHNPLDMARSGEPPSRKRRALPRFSLQRLLFGSPRKRRSARSASRSSGNGGPERVVSLESLAVAGPSHLSAMEAIGEDVMIECPVCLDTLPASSFPRLTYCSHKSCRACLKQYLTIEIMESRVRIMCPQCSEPLHPTDIKHIVEDPALMNKYDEFMVRRALATDADARWCPAPDCGYAVIAAGCASCPRLECGRPGCSASFCYHCQAEWHPNQTCDAARSERLAQFRPSAAGGQQSPTSSLSGDNIKNCPRCRIVIVKMDDGSCNHMTCGLCGAEFCWLCMQEISDLHYLSPSGCTFWGKKPWSRKKKILWQLGTLVGAPVGVALLAGIAVPAMIIGIPVWVGKKLYVRYRSGNKHRRNAFIGGGVLLAALTSPALSLMAVSIGVPILLAYIYGVVPFSLCRAGGCGLSTTPQGVRFEFDDENDALDLAAGARQTDAGSSDTLSHRPGTPYPSIGEGFGLWASSSQLDRAITGPGESDRESASVTAVAPDSLTPSVYSGGATSCRMEAGTGKRLSFCSDARSERSLGEAGSLAADARSERSVGTTSLLDDQPGASTRALAGSIVSYKMSDTLSQLSTAEHGGRSVSPGSSFSGDETAALAAGRRFGRRATLDRQGSCADDTASTRSSARGDDELSVRWIDEGPPPPTAGGARWPAGRRPRRSRAAAVRAELAAPHVATVSSAAAAADLPPVEAGVERRVPGKAGAPRARSSELLLVHGRAPPAPQPQQALRKSLPCLLTAPLVD
ncbi:E3 ubiquitin-protein ligase RNF19A-like isoform X2 [Amphibalanus amphitrite]|uniref:E3 ubiquitin-protein ligase RNF19A-like isoform X2 n=1 Tax=Amphibalanus amphitrite TaxID=1232801 RepID=UPI001C90F352|nr:E3 ubiquitin-protein ligase RNF19A-like isoform X2 [Amphibalanus amphitrite]